MHRQLCQILRCKYKITEVLYLYSLPGVSHFYFYSGQYKYSTLQLTPLALLRCLSIFVIAVLETPSLNLIAYYIQIFFLCFRWITEWISRPEFCDIKHFHSLHWRYYLLNLLCQQTKTKRCISTTAKVFYFESFTSSNKSTERSCIKFDYYRRIWNEKTIQEVLYILSMNHHSSIPVNRQHMMIKQRKHSRRYTVITPLCWVSIYPVKLFRCVMQHFCHFSPVLWHYRRHVVYRRIL